jgi:hypothetical protein
MDNWKLRERLTEIARLARYELDAGRLAWPTLVALTAIERSAKLAVAEMNTKAGSNLTPTPAHLRIVPDWDAA